MKMRFLLVTAALAAGTAAGLIALGPGVPGARAQGAAQPDVAELKAQIDALRALIPSQSHAMADVDYHFSSLWFAVRSNNWPLARFYLNETRSHLNWAVRIRPVRRLSSGAELDLRPLLQGVEDSGIATLRTALDLRDKKLFEQAYRQTIKECFACHQAAEKPFLKPHIPESAAARMIDFRPAAAPK
ncbi:MAG TPA: hypothetical protein VMK05_04765 [Burkholderiales bacterium]|nr:hypothetical protein [Burkholderiales bacterium]